MTLFFKALAEMGGTFALIFVGGASIILTERNILPSICVPIAWGLMVFLMIIAVGHISGAHFNPAVTLAFAVAKRIPVDQIWFYWASQAVGGVAAVNLLRVLGK
jgi:aquaporin NIP